MTVQRHNLQWKRKLESISFELLAILVTLVFLVPIVWMVSSSFKMPKDILSLPPKVLFEPTIDNYRAVFTGEANIAGATFPAVKNFPKSILNSLVISLSATFVALLIGTPSAYTISKFTFRGKNTIAGYILGARMAPPMAILIPYYMMFSLLRLTDTHISLIIVYSVLNLPFVVLMMRGYFKEIHHELEDAARIDGCDRLGTFFRVSLPLTAPGLVATSIFCLILSWNEFLFALVLSGNVTKTAPVALYNFISFHEVIWGALFAAGSLVTLPVLIFALLVQRNLVRGLTLGAVK